ncbi:neurotransmitter:Na+ symporter, NSS family [Paucidesulfovibrio gracilis DSM 16080]|uniref:Transporter n=1 Tax=Paucidesulfovibrio gracilis DSM 16080 TaxID=1121449 RepID=A0A1T4Y1W2_9BACT|nr:sodium-dependent transporter [Paucidesulfovibrio gracilis]SKA95807.1 neurotransmitter:Na+ symporter, NSS family [Paucidesulfovibrio gracilis DSM 16080]
MSKRETWSSRTGFILAAVGSAIGLGNIWRFPYMVYENGGGAFLIPYFVAMLTAGIPFMILEFGLGHRFRGSAPKIFSSISRKMEWLGWWQVVVAAFIATYYVVVVSWAINYFVLSFSLGWGDLPKDFFFGEFLQLTDSPLNIGGLNMSVFYGVLVAWGVTFLAVFTGVRGGVERANKIFMPVLFVLVLVFIARGVTLPGAGEGLEWLFHPDFNALLDYSVWADAYGQIFYSLSIGFAIMLAYSSYLPKRSDIANNASMTVFINCGFSMLAGLMIFSVLGYMAMQQNVPVSEVAGAGVGLAFVTLPTAINLMPMPSFFGALFFLALVVAGLSSQISISEAVVSAVMDKLDMSRKLAASLFCGVGLVLSLAYAMDGGLYLLDIVDHFVNNHGVLLGGLAEILFVAWFCDLESLRKHINNLSDFSVSGIWTAALRIIVPPMLTVVCVSNLVGDLTANYGDYSTKVIVLFGWGMLLVCAVLAILFSVRKGAFGSSSTLNANFLRR